MKYYNIVYSVIDCETMATLHQSCSTKLSEMELPKEITTLITWDNLNEIYKQHRAFLGIEIRNKKKGRIIDFYYDWLGFRPIKEWKREVRLFLKIEYKEINCSIQEILDYPDSKKAIQYLTERGLDLKGML